MNRKQTNSRKAIDPVCGMAVAPETASFRVRHDGVDYFFCAETCRRSFEANPKQYMDPARPKGIWGRYLERLNKATGGKPPCCH